MYRIRPGRAIYVQEKPIVWHSTPAYIRGWTGSIQRTRDTFWGIILRGSDSILMNFFSSVWNFSRSSTLYNRIYTFDGHGAIVKLLILPDATSALAP